jgi:hypothetical protein
MPVNEPEGALASVDPQPVRAAPELLTHRLRVDREAVLAPLLVVAEAVPAGTLYRVPAASTTTSDTLTAKDFAMVSLHEAEHGEGVLRVNDPPLLAEDEVPLPRRWRTRTDRGGDARRLAQHHGGAHGRDGYADDAISPRTRHGLTLHQEANVNPVLPMSY